MFIATVYGLRRGDPRGEGGAKPWVIRPIPPSGGFHPEQMGPSDLFATMALKEVKGMLDLWLSYLVWRALRDPEGKDRPIDKGA